MSKWLRELALMQLLFIIVTGLYVSALRSNPDGMSNPFRANRTMGSMRSLGTALGPYQVDFGGYPLVGAEATWSLLSPNYIVEPPRRDGWRTPFHYFPAQPVNGFAQSYTITSYGADLIGNGWFKRFTAYFDCDIIYGDGQFVQSPAPELLRDRRDPRESPLTPGGVLQDR